MQNLYIKICCVSREQLFFSCCVVCISMTPECWGQYVLENRDCIPSDGANGLGTVSMVYRRPARLLRSSSDGIPQVGAYGSLHKVGIPSSGVQRVNILFEIKLVVVKQNNIKIAGKQTCLLTIQPSPRSRGG